MVVHLTRVEAVRGSVLEQDTEVIVNAANRRMRGGGGVDGAIHQAAGPLLLKKLIEVAPQGAEDGQVVITPAFDMPQKYIYHAVGPRWQDGEQGEYMKLSNCYWQALLYAHYEEASSISFCSISTGIFGFPLERAAPLAVETVRLFLMRSPITTLQVVRFALFKEEEFAAYSEAIEKLGDYFPSR